MSINPPKVNLKGFENEQTFKDKKETKDYSALLGKDSWSRLHPDIQKRFGENVHESVTYHGEMKEIYASFAGKVLAQVCRLIGTPLAIDTGTNIPIMVKVYPNHKLAGMTWNRFYAFPNKAVNRVKSTKCIRANDGLVEMVGCGFGMSLEVYEENSALHFVSRDFFWQFGKTKFRIPDFLSPGKTVVSQKALSDGRFEFSLDVTHSLLGKVFRQVGVFEQI